MLTVFVIREETLSKEVKELREKLADYNAMVDNLRTQTELVEIRQQVRLRERLHDVSSQPGFFVFRRRR